MQETLPRRDSGASIPEAVDIFTSRGAGRDANLIGFHQVGGSGWVDVQHRDEGERLRKLEFNVVAEADQHMAGIKQSKYQGCHSHKTERVAGYYVQMNG